MQAGFADWKPELREFLQLFHNASAALPFFACPDQIFLPSALLLQASLARTPGSAYTGTFYAFAIVGMVPLAILKVVNIAAGIISLVIYSVVAASVVRIYPLHVIWRDVCLSSLLYLSCKCTLWWEISFSQSKTSFSSMCSHWSIAKLGDCHWSGILPLHPYVQDWFFICLSVHHPHSTWTMAMSVLSELNCLVRHNLRSVFSPLTSTADLLSQISKASPQGLLLCFTEKFSPKQMEDWPNGRAQSHLPKLLKPFSYWCEIALQVVPYIMASICVSGAAIIASSCLILTELAGDSLRQTVSCSLQDVGHMLSLWVMISSRQAYLSCNSPFQELPWLSSESHSFKLPVAFDLYNILLVFLALIQIGILQPFSFEQILNTSVRRSGLIRNESFCAMSQTIISLMDIYFHRLAGTILADNDGCFESTCHQRDLGKKGALEAFSSSQALKEEVVMC